MITAQLAVENLMNGHRVDLWTLNADAEYQEEADVADIGKLSAQSVATAVDHALVRAFGKLDTAALGAAMGTVSGLVIFFATAWLVIKGGPLMGQNLGLLSQYFPGYTVSVPGSILGLGYGFVVGFLVGWLFAFLRNGAVVAYMSAVHRRAELHVLRKFPEHF